MRGWLGGLLLLVACKSKAPKLEAAEACVCKAHEAHLTWSAPGSPTLSATPKPDKWTDGKVDADGTRAAVLLADTKFMIDVAGGSEPKGEKDRTAEVRVIDGHRDGGVNASSCDAAKRVVTAPMPKKASCEMALLAIDHPTVALTDQYTPRDVCLVAPDGQRYCAPKGAASPNIGRVVDDTWKIEIALADGETCEPQQYPGSVNFGFDLDCDHPPAAAPKAVAP